MTRRWVVMVCVMIPTSSVCAAVSINEIAWMGSTESANYEWIELYNDGAATDVTGWVLSDGMNLSIDLTGVIPANTYVVLERTSEASAPGSAFMIYTGALVNGGATLRLENQNGTLIDQVSGGENWEQVGGDNTTKETAQYTSGGWITAAGTPGAANATVSSGVDVTTDDTDGSVEKRSAGPLQKPKKKESVPLVLPGVDLKLKIVAQEIGYINQEINFDVTPSGIGKHLIDSLSYEWNFGDGSVSSAKEPTHIFSYPGTYVVTVYAGFKRQEQVARHEITILPVDLSLTMNEFGDVQVNNDSPYEIDLSGYRVVSDDMFVFPLRTIILPNQTITIPSKKLGGTNNHLVAVYDAEATLLATAGYGAERVEVENVFLADTAPEPRISAISYSPPIAVVAETLLASGSEAEVEEEFIEETEEVSDLPGVRKAEAAGSQVASASAAPRDLPERWPYMALAIVLLIATLGVYAAPRRNQTE